jgi:hypothetical protein
MLNGARQRAFMRAGLRCPGLIAREGPVRNLLLSGGFAALLLGAGVAVAVPTPDPLVITLDGRHYVTYSPITISPRERLVQAPELRMRSCQRSDGERLSPGAFRLIYSNAGDFVDAVALRIRFAPTRVELDTIDRNVTCMLESFGGENGVARIFRGRFETP